ncbi:MAG TPA: 30S ribosomal protein S6 [Bacilli bacterium]|nr:30S ribosomal protein S6 [Bacilli bacterium]
MNKYEIMFIVKSGLESETLKNVTEELKNTFKSKELEFKDMGQKKLAYPIKKEVTGYYYLITTEATPKEIDNFRHKVLINENVIRHLIINLNEE